MVLSVYKIWMRGGTVYYVCLWWTTHGGGWGGGYNGLILYHNPMKPGSMGSNPSHSRAGDSGCTKVPRKNSGLYSSASVAMASGCADQVHCL